MTGWMETTSLKKTQRRINACIRRLNKNIERDELWKGRFCIRQIKRQFWREDGYLYLHVLMRYYDKQTGATEDHWYRKEDFFFPCSWRIWEHMNSFIVETCKVWEEDPRPHRNTSKDYRKVEV